MQDLREKAAYLRGLLEGADYPQDEKQKLVWDGLISFCEGVADEVGELEDTQNEFAEYIEAIDEDLSSLEKYFYNNNDENDDADLIFSKDSDSPVMEMTCPNCNQNLYFEDEPGDYQVVCPDCGKVVWNHFITENDSERKNELM